ncbi:hypothetical protein JCM18882A_25360 [Brevibacterium metallidurans]|uniref:LPXTG-motif cell wall anchor domain-containing protein n=2 Tax=Brevibacterium TaxID=1696 RepID=A0ABP9TZU0_9MICO
MPSTLARAVRRRRRRCAAAFVLLTAVTVAILGIAAPASAKECPTSIAEAVRVSETDGSGESAPDDLQRAFPDVPELMAPGSGGDDELRVRSIAEVPVTAVLIVAPETAGVADPAHDLQVSITWAGRTVAKDSYRKVVGQRFALGELAPDADATLRVSVDLPAVGERDNDTQTRTWPLRFSLGLSTGVECAPGGSDAGGSAAEADDSGGGTAAEAETRADSDGTSAAGSSSEASSSGSSGISNSSAGSAGGAGSADGGWALPRTGFGGAGLITLAAAAIGLGLALVAVARRRRAGQRHVGTERAGGDARQGGAS